jgi:predicted transcriptional regulator
MVQLTDDLLELLDRRAAVASVSRSALIREALEVFLAADRDELIDRQIVEGYTRVPQGGERDADEWGNVARQMAVLTTTQMRQLNEEERAAGFEPW